MERPTRTPRARHVPLRLIALVALLPLLGTTTLLALGARSVAAAVTGELRKGQADLDQGRHLLEDAYHSQNPRLVDQAAARFTSSQRHFRQTLGVLPGAGLRLAPYAPGAVRTGVDSLRAV